MEAGELASRARTIAQLADIVQAMRTLASARRRQAQERFSGLERYASVTRDALGRALALEGVPGGLPAPGPARVILLLSEHGFVGPLNDRLIDEAIAGGAGGAAAVLTVGTRGQRLCRERGVDAADGGSMPTTISAVQTTAQRLIELLFGDVAEGRVGETVLVFAELVPPVGWRPRRLRLFPPDVSAHGRGTDDAPALHTLDPDVLALRAMEEYAFAQLSWAVGVAFASEQAARFVAMDSARHHIEEKLAELRAIERRLRQETITNEILEIASGAASMGLAP